MFGDANGAVYVERRADVTRLRRSTTPLGGAALSPLQMHPLTKDEARRLCLAQNNNVVQALAPDRSNQPLGKAILPR